VYYSFISIKILQNSQQKKILPSAMYCKEGLGFCSENKNTASHQPKQSLTAARQSLTVVQDSSGGSGVSSKISVLQTVL